MKISQILSIALVIFALVACDDKKASENTTKAPEKASVASETKTNETEATAVSLKAEDTNAEAKYAKFEFEETKFDFGDIQQGDVVEHTFKFKNVGEVPLLITDTQVTCGCTTPEFTKEPVAPGESGEILVKFNSAGKSGNTSKNVTINANVEGGRSIIRITTNILTGQEGPYKQ
ncbi:MAG: DUF1573 domain-containing protein [Flammeovirgaceae bacterium]